MNNYDNRKLIVPFYKEEEIDVLDTLVFPFSDRYMRYDKRTHQYFLTERALDKYGITLGEEYLQNTSVFLKKVTDAVYSYIKEKAGAINYPYMMYRVAKGYGSPNLSPYDARNMFFNDVLVTQAQFMSTSGYAKDVPKVIMNTEYGRVKASDLSATDGYWLHDDVITTLNALGLTSSQRISGRHAVNWGDY